VGFLTGGNSRELAGLPGNGPAAVITDLCILRPHPVSRELEVTSVHPGVNRESILKSTGWEIRFSDSCSETAGPNPLELQTLRDLKQRTAAAHGVEGDAA
jgi:glutaconate CoA-transferase subunit B